MKVEKSFIAILALLIVAAGVSAAMYFRQVNEEGSAKAKSLAMQIGQWKGEDIELSDRTYKVLETKNVAMRKYTNPQNESVYLYIVVSEINRKVAHPPEICYTGSGADITEKSEVQIEAGKENLTVNRFVSRQDGKESLVYYWFKAGNKFTPSYLDQQAKAMLSQLAGRKPDIAMIRVSTYIINGNKEKASQLLQEFTRSLIQYLTI
jgi:EpsI family protein